MRHENMRSTEKSVHQDQSPAVTQVLQDVHAPVWQFNIQSKELKCSAGFLAAIGHELDGEDITYSRFINYFLYYEDIPLLLKETNSCEPGCAKTLEIRLLTKEGFQWFQNTFRREQGPILTGSVINIHQFKTMEFELAAKNNRYANVVKVAKSGSWEIDIKTQTLLLSNEACHILEVPKQNNASINDLIRLFIPEHRPILTNSVNAAIGIGKPIDLDLQVKTGSNQVIWIKIKGLTTIDEYGRGITVRGVLQNIDQTKRKENELLSSFEFLEHQNKRLQTFAYMVSHNLRSHTNNLQYLVSMHEESEDVNEKKEIFAHIATISDSLNTTIQHLNEIVKIEADIKQERIEIAFEPVFRNVIDALESNIEQTEAVVKFDFTACPTVNYIPAYLESILHNFLTNSLKYRHPDRRPEILCNTKITDGNVYLTFKDNGMGIDMAKFGNKMFGMYQTFHAHSDAKGIGLFITRNQIEALGGNIEVASHVGVGTTFKVRLGSCSE